MTWIDNQPAEKIAADLGKMRASAAAGGAHAQHCMQLAGDDERFALWMLYADMRCVRRFGISINDLADFNSRDLYEAGSSPKEALIEALTNDDLYSSFGDSDE